MTDKQEGGLVLYEDLGNDDYSKVGRKESGTARVGNF